MKSNARAVWMLFALALAVRLIFFTAIIATRGQAGLALPAHSDSQNYTAIARNLVLGRGYSRQDQAPFIPDPKRTPAYPLFIAATEVVAGETPWLAVILQIILGAVTVIVVYQLGKELWNERAGRIAAVAAAIQPYSAFIATQVLTETLFTFFFALAALMTLRLYRSLATGRAALAGICFGLAALTRPIGEYLPYMALLLLLSMRAGRKSLVTAAVLILSFGIVIAPWIYRNYRLAGVPTISYEANILLDIHYGAFTAYRATGNLSDFSAYRLVSSEEGLTETPRDEFARRLVAVAVRHPVSFVTYLGISTAPFFFGDGLRSIVTAFSPAGAVFGWDFAVTKSGVLGALGIGTMPAWLVALGIVFKLFWALTWIAGAVGIVALIRRGAASRMAAMLFLIFLAYFAVAGGPVNSARYRLPLEPILFVVAAVGLVSRLDRDALVG